MAVKTYVVKRYTILLTDDICARLWQAYEKDVVEILNESEFLEVFGILTDNPGKRCFADVVLMYPDDGVFEKIFIDSLREETFICEHYMN